MPSLFEELRPRIYRIRQSRAKRGGEFAVEGLDPAARRWQLMITCDGEEFAREWVKSWGGIVQEE